VPRSSARRNLERHLFGTALRTCEHLVGAGQGAPRSDTGEPGAANALFVLGLAM